MPTAKRVLPADRRGTAFRWLADRIAADPKVRATGALVTLATGDGQDDDPAAAARHRVWLDMVAAPVEEFASWHPTARSQQAPIDVLIEVQTPEFHPDEDLVSLYGIVENAANRAVLADLDGSRAAGISWLEPGTPPQYTTEGGLSGSVRAVVFLTRSPTT